MSATAVTSVASFSVVLAEVFAAVGLSTTVPAAAVTLARLLKYAQLPPAGNNGGTLATIDASAAQTGLMTALNKLPSTGPLKPEDLKNLLNAVSAALPSLDLLLPKSAKIHAEFAFEGSEGMTGGVEGGVAVNVVSVKAGYSGMYEMSSSNKITLDINFESVNVVL